VSKPYHLPLLIDGTSYVFTHLEPCLIAVSSSKVGRGLQIRVLYSNHCFSRKFDSDFHPEGSLTFTDQRGELRVFDSTRYDLSLLLPEIIQRLAHPQTKVWQTSARRNWLHSTTIESDIGPYHVFFELRRAGRGEGGQDLNLTVESAYPQMGRPAPSVLGAMGFALLAGKVYLREPTTTRR
jgi:hypothetical protein